MYKDGEENAWVTFSKNLGIDDVWFQGSRVLDSYPWNTQELRDNATHYAFHMSSEGIFWLISEGTKRNSGAIGYRSAHAHWLVLKTSSFCDLSSDTQLPVILYSRESRPSYLATEGKKVH